MSVPFFDISAGSEFKRGAVDCLGVFQTVMKGSFVEPA